MPALLLRRGLVCQIAMTDLIFIKAGFQRRGCAQWLRSTITVKP